MSQKTHAEAGKTLIPSLRFKEFQEIWVKSDLGSLSTNISYGIGAAATEFDGENKYLRITDIDEQSSEFKPNPLTSPDGVADIKYRLKKGDIVFARTGASVGKSYLYREADGNLVFAGFLIKFSIIGADPRFIFATTLRDSYNKWVHIFSMRSGQPGLNAEEYKRLKVVHPTLPEQQKIASFLSAVDQKIQQLTQKATLLEAYKKGVMQQLFSGELRFKDENGDPYPDWEEIRLIDIAEKSSSNISANSIKENEGEYEIYGASGVLKRVDFFQQENPFISIVKDGAGVGRTLLCNPYSSVLGTLDIIRPKHNVNLYFLFSIFQNIRFEKFIIGSTIPHIYFKDYSCEKCALPVLKEQQKIASFLSGIDSKIESVRNQITQTQSFKKALLQQMFV